MSEKACPHCGKPLNENASFCPYCAEPINVRNEVCPPRRTPRRANLVPDIDWFCTVRAEGGIFIQRFSAVGAGFLRQVQIASIKCNTSL